MKSHVKLTNEERYKLFSECKDDISRQIISAVLYTHFLKGHKKKRLQAEFDDIINVLNMPDIMGKQIEGIDLMNWLHDNFEIDFSRVNAKTETEKEYMKRGKADD